MNPIFIDDLLKEYRDCVARHNLGKPGHYCRFTAGERADFSINEYGVADAANILYTLGDFAEPITHRDQWVQVLQGMQDPKTGMFHEATHYPEHTTAHCSAALELFDARPLYPCTALEEFKDINRFYEYMENNVRWADDPWTDSHLGAGIFVSMVNTDMVDLDWKNGYFKWFWDNTDPETGFPIYKPEVNRKQKNYKYMAGAFHYFFNHESEHRPMRYPEKVIDTCLDMMETRDGTFVLHCNFIDVDVVYCLSRAMRQSPHRFYEAKAILEKYAEDFLDMLLNRTDYQNDIYFNDLHALFGSICCLAELQSALPGKIISSKPLKLVLDRRPFI